ncbi:hypothetical protein OJ996_23475 [Luteolibacter sp. GHJ8]|uniref:DUF4288 domain-containing protein n=1 Tax=Luteolibacter rhizosphaerae TaxID=2989719 RepID=A0ABT3G9Q3_9BACT|nr:hypothetical protein [Luteolibacter rhizosphaerae]MCW1916568.1 hypothetical protein [Luteolibacter rhizosphaerae]
MPSYTVRCLFEWSADRVETLKHLYEERITLWNAATFEEAIELAEQEASEYAEEHGFTFIQLSQAFWMFSEVQGSGVEVYSLLRESDLEPDAYLNAFFDTGFEREEDVRAS